MHWQLHDSASQLFFRREKQHWHIPHVEHLLGDIPEDAFLQAALPMSTHHDQVNPQSPGYARRCLHATSFSALEWTCRSTDHPLRQGLADFVQVRGSFLLVGEVTLAMNGFGRVLLDDVEQDEPGLILLCKSKLPAGNTVSDNFEPSKGTRIFLIVISFS